MDNVQELTCPACGEVVSPSMNFCSQCGTKLKEPPFSISIAKQALVYFVSFFLAPFGLGYAFKYLKIPDGKAKRVGIVAILLTIIGIATVLITANTFIESLYSSFDLLDF